MTSDTKHTINNYLQVILWALEEEATEESKLSARKAVAEISEELRNDKGVVHE